MAKRLQHRGGTTSQHSTFTGAVREVTVDTDKNTLVVHDGATAGGKPLPTLTGTETFTNKTLTSPVFSGTATNFTSTGIDDNATSTAITIDSGEKVGIGTSSPSRNLQVAGTNAVVAIKTTDDTYSSVFFGDTSADNIGKLLYDHTDNSLQTIVNNAERMRIDSSGNVGIGTSSPSGSDFGSQTGLIHLKDVGGLNTGVKLEQGVGKSFWYQNATDTYFGSGSSTPLRFYTNQTQRMCITSAGNVGIGTSSPESALDVSTGTITQREGSIRNTISSSSTGFEFIANATSLNVTRNFVFKSSTSGGGVTERMRIDSSGNLKFDSGYGSAATAYGVRAWVNFNGQGTVTIRGSGNVSSITDSGTGQYYVNFTNNMPDTNFSTQATTKYVAGSGIGTVAFLDNANLVSRTHQIITAKMNNNYSTTDPDTVNVMVMR